MNIRDMLDYDPQTGEFFWKKRPNKGRGGKTFNVTWVGRLAGGTNDKRYINIKIHGRLYAAHRLAWLYVYGAWPKGDIDHINGDRADNRIANLRQATRGENMQNKRRYRNNSCGFTGVTRVGNKWAAQISLAGKRMWLGRFDTPERAYAEYLRRKSELHTFNPTPAFEEAVS